MQQKIIDKQSGKCGENLAWTFSDGMLTISGTGAMDDYSPGDAAWQSCTNHITTVVIGTGLTAIGENAFFLCPSLTEINVAEANDNYSSENGVLFNKNKTTLICYPENKMGAYTIPDSVTTISEESFWCCCNLTSVTIPDSVTAIGNETFSACLSLTEINIGEANKNYFSENGVLFNKDKTTLICYPQGKTGAYTIPRSVTSIGNSAFNCEGLTSITIPNSIATIDRRIFSGCCRLTEINIDEANNNYATENGVLFNKDKTTLIRYPEGKTGAYTIPDSVTIIDQYAFWSCLGLTSVTIKNGVTTIGYAAFSSCKLTTIIIPASVTAIGEWAFYYCDRLEEIHNQGPTPQIINENVFDWFFKIVLYVPAGSLEAYKKAEVWKDFLNIQENIEIKR